MEPCNSKGTIAVTTILPVLHAALFAKYKKSTGNGILLTETNAFRRAGPAAFCTGNGALIVWEAVALTTDNLYSVTFLVCFS